MTAHTRAHPASDDDLVLCDTRGAQINPLHTTMTAAQALDDSLGPGAGTKMTWNESPLAAVSRVLLRETGSAPSNVLAMMLIDAVRDTIPPPREVTIGMLAKILRSLEPTQALDTWAIRASREIVKILSRRPEVQPVTAALVDDEIIWCELEGTIAGLLLRVCCGQDLDNVEVVAAEPRSVGDGKS